MSNETVRVGFVGAGANTRLRHIRGFKPSKAWSWQAWPTAAASPASE